MQLEILLSGIRNVSLIPSLLMLALPTLVWLSQHVLLGACKKRWCGLVVAMALTCVAQAGGLSLTPEMTQHDLAPYLEVLEDPAGMLSLEEVALGEASSRFTAWHGKGDLHLGSTSSAWWIRVALQRAPDAPNRWIIEMPYLNLDYLDFYWPGQAAVHTGSARSLVSRPVLHRFFVFPLELREASTYLYIRVTSAYALTVPMTIWQPEAFVRSSQQKIMLQWMYTGGLLALMLYNLLIYVSLRDSRFVIYALYVGVFGLGMLAGNGLGRLELWPDAVRFDAVSQSFFLALAAALSVILTRVFLGTPHLSVWLSRGLTACAWIMTSLAVGYLASTRYTLGVQNLHITMNVVVLPCAVLIMAAGVMAMRKRQMGARFFVLAWCVLWLGAIVSALRALGWIPTTTLTAYSLQLSSAVEMLLLALALADLIRLERNATAAAQAQALEASETMLATLRASGEKLEQAVAQRTQELAEALEKERHLHEQQSRLGALISHEFRNPLGIIDSQISLLRKEKAVGRMQIEKRIDIMVGAVRRLRALFDTWLTSDRVRKSLEVADIQWFQLDEWLRRWMQSNAHLASNHQLEIQGLEQPCLVQADQDLLAIAVTNLVDNACKYSPAGSPVYVELRNRPGQAGIAVIDHGTGIEPEHHKEIFEDYYRAHPEGAVTGMGLGLAFVASVAKIHHGQIELQSQPGHGSTFCLWLPTSESHQPE